MIHALAKYWLVFAVLLLLAVLMFTLWILFSGSGYNEVPSRGVFI